MPIPLLTRRAQRHCLLLLIVAAFLGFAFLAYLWLPELATAGTGADNIGLAGGRHGGPLEIDPHALQDKRALYGKIQADQMRQAAYRQLIDRLHLAETELVKLRKQIEVEKLKLTNLTRQAGLQPMHPEHHQQQQPAPPAAASAGPVNHTVLAMRDKVRDMMRFAWTSYERYAWGMNELRPVSKIGHTTTIFGSQPIGATIVDAVDTLYMMNLQDEFKKARDWIKDNLQFDKDTQVSVFEMNIRFIGGLLSVYYMSGDRLFVDKAVQLADRLLPAFNTPTGIPYALVNLKTKVGKNYNWAAGSCSILSEIGTLHMEFAALSEITGNSVYLDKVLKIRSILAKANKPNGLYPNYIHPSTASWCQQHSSLAGLGDSFYEYLIKEWLRSGKADAEAKQLFDESLPGIERHMLRTSDSARLLYLADVKFGRIAEKKMDHLACFAGGMFALGAHETRQSAASSSTSTSAEAFANKWIQIGARITATCRESYERTAVKLGPESFRFDSGVEAVAVRVPEKVYILRPETVESYFYMWRLTHDQKYRDWAWDVVRALETYCRAEAGYSGLRDVYSPSPGKDDVQQSYFLAETLKYLYLIFSDDSFFPLDRWVFNTEAHPLPIRPYQNSSRISFDGQG
ncbi:hypothetical protein BOX15_Mlig014089g5 [Macrostomum lignano]|uniref:Uncharacterized protein n=2 Tax=Macrostomum lignano TaxID=282301 RepID=A0A267EQC8_9PLAT|nr:hypothetical protein BOX15_Mlig003262g1 [Macrostomum lignano]PAA63050.1 hypothetical protein BOX15_Mlig014089g4 [Macrostomum lignano]PAA92201.1 hypothetical protein BOX15_Mlig014089g5 [Macrostomum lignano]